MRLKDFFKPKPVDWKQSTYLVIMVCICLFTGYIGGFYKGTGTLPNFALFPEDATVATPKGLTTTLTDIQVTLEEAPDEEYAFGYNCVDFAWDAMRQLAWKGHPSAMVMLMFEELPNHALLLVPTTDKDWLFIEPQAGIVVKPRVGGLYNGRTITEIKIMTIVWVSLDEFIETPVFEEVK